MLILPSIGAKGIYELAVPFQAQLAVNTPYTCVAIRKTEDVQAEGVDPYAEYYQPAPFNIGESKYIEDVRKGVCIISLVSDKGQWLHVPSTYILKFPNLNGVNYTNVIIGVSLGAIPDTLNLSAVKTELAAVVTNMLGVASPEVKEVAVSETAVLSNATHDSLEASRQLNIINSSTSNAKYLVEKARADALAIQNALLKQWIKDHQTP
ncbi:MAG: hypothetical protein E6Q68_06885 [Polynucleobacter sp.]|nr:MAG: hypothetical protein E6Q68_06885 [Polynucleobacter sp.]